MASDALDTQQCHNSNTIIFRICGKNLNFLHKSLRFLFESNMENRRVGFIFIVVQRWEGGNDFEYMYVRA